MFIDDIQTFNHFGMRKNVTLSFKLWMILTFLENEDHDVVEKSLFRPSGALKSAATTYLQAKTKV